MKDKIIILAAAAAMLAGCGDTQKIDGLLSSAQTPESSSDVSLNAADLAAVSEAESLAAQLSAPDPSDVSIPDTSDGTVDIDLTKLGSTMVYSQVYSMLTEPEKYIGKTVRAKGPFGHNYNDKLNIHYFAVVISDATACCAQGLEFELPGKHTFPDDYPEVGTEVIVEGKFTTYMEEGTRYCRLENAVMTEVK